MRRVLGVFNTLCYSRWTEALAFVKLAHYRRSMTVVALLFSVAGCDQSIPLLGVGSEASQGGTAGSPVASGSSGGTLGSGGGAGTNREMVAGGNDGVGAGGTGTGGTSRQGMGGTGEGVAVDCASLSEAECRQQAQCVAVTGVELFTDHSCYRPTSTTFSCRDLSRQCEATITPARSEDGRCWRFPDACLSPGFSPPNAGQCHGGIRLGTYACPAFVQLGFVRERPLLGTYDPGTVSSATLNYTLDRTWYADGGILERSAGAVECPGKFFLGLCPVGRSFPVTDAVISRLAARLDAIPANQCNTNIRTCRTGAFPMVFANGRMIYEGPCCGVQGSATYDDAVAALVAELEMLVRAGTR